MSVKYLLHKSLDLFYFVCDMSGAIIIANDLFEENTSHIKPKTVDDLIVDSYDKNELLKAIEKSKAHPSEPIRFYCRIKQKNQSLRWNLFNVYFILNSLHFVGVPILDISNIPSHEYERQKTLLEDIRFMLSHEIRQPLTSIAGLCDLMLSKSSEEPNNENIELIKMMREAVERLDDSIKKLVKKAAQQI